MILLQEMFKKRPQNLCFFIRGACFYHEKVRTLDYKGVRTGILCGFEFYRTAIYSNMSRLLGALKVAKTKGNLEAELKKIERCQPLILDDAFLVPLDVKERAILLDIIEDRHEWKSIILSSQLPVSSWYDAVGDPTVADAVLDRIVHTAHQIELIGESVRKIKAGK